LLHALERNEPFELIHNLIYRSGEQIIKTVKDELYDPDELPALPYETLKQFQPVKKNPGQNILRTKKNF